METSQVQRWDWDETRKPHSWAFSKALHSQVKAMCPRGTIFACERNMFFFQILVSKWNFTCFVQIQPRAQSIAPNGSTTTRTRHGATVNWSSPGPVLDVTLTAGWEQVKQSHFRFSLVFFFKIIHVKATTHPNLAKTKGDPSTSQLGRPCHVPRSQPSLKCRSLML